MTDFSKTRHMFDIPAGMIYLNGNSLGPMPKAAPKAINSFLMDEWRTELVRGWNTKNWFMQSNTLGDWLGRLMGAPAGSTVVGDTLSIRVFQAVAASLALAPDRRVILSDSGNFPTDLYMVEGLMGLRDVGYELRTPAPEDVLDHITQEVATVMVTEVDYRSGRKHDMQAIIKKHTALAQRWFGTWPILSVPFLSMSTAQMPTSRSDVPINSSMLAPVDPLSSMSHPACSTKLSLCCQAGLRMRLHSLLISTFARCRGRLIACGSAPRQLQPSHCLSPHWIFGMALIC